MYFFSGSGHLTASSYVTDHKENLNQFQKEEILEAIFLAANLIKLEISNVHIKTLN